MTRRQAPAPSSNPGGDSPACTNEIQYLNFDITDATQLAHVQAVHRAFCSGYYQLVSAGFSDLGHPDDDITVYNRFFPQNADKQSEIGDIYYSLIDTLRQETKPITATFIIDNNDLDSACLESGDDTPNEDASEEGGY
jgi:hypothetical protein